MMRLDADVAHLGCNGATEIVNAPRSHSLAKTAVEIELAAPPGRKPGAGAITKQVVAACSRHRLNDFQHRFRQRDRVRTMVLGSASGSVHVPASRSSSDQHRPPTSARRLPPRTKSRMILSKSPMPSHVRQIAANSISVGTWSRGAGSAGRCAPTTGLAPSPNRPSAMLQLKNALSARRAAAAVVTLWLRMMPRMQAAASVRVTAEIAIGCRVLK